MTATGPVTSRQLAYPAYRGAGSSGHTDRRVTLRTPSAPTTRSARDSPPECSTVPSGRTALTVTPGRSASSGTAARSTPSRSARWIMATGP